MNKELLKESIARVEQNIKDSEENRDKAIHYLEESKVILEALKAKL